jgi:hypothetical protein
MPHATFQHAHPRRVAIHNITFVHDAAISITTRQCMPHGICAYSLHAAVLLHDALSAVTAHCSAAVAIAAHPSSSTQPHASDMAAPAPVQQLLPTR